MRLPLAIVVATLAAGSGCRGRTGASPAPAPEDVALAPSCAIAPAPDTALVRIVGRVTPVDSARPVPRAFAHALLTEVGRRLRLPPQLSVETWEPYARLAGAAPAPREPGVQALSAEVEFHARGGRGIARVGFISSSLAPQFDVALQDALLAMAEEGQPAMPDSVRGWRAMRLVVESTFVPDTAGAVLLEMRAPLVRFDSLVRAMPDNPTPTHPRHLRDRGIEGQATVRFVVDRRGGPVLESLRVMSADDPAFAEAAAVALMFSRFRPAVIDGCRVASVAEMTYRFALR